MKCYIWTNVRQCDNISNIKPMNYSQERNQKYTNKLRKELLPALPSFCAEFIVGISMNTTVLTRYNYASDIKTFLIFCVSESGKFFGMDIKDITIKDLDTLKAVDFEIYLDYLSNYQTESKSYQNKESAKARKFCALRALFRYLYTHDKIKQNVTEKVSMPKIREKTILRLDDNEVNEVFDNFEVTNLFSSDNMNNYNNNNTKLRDIAIITLLLTTGIRVSELVGINMTDLDMENKKFSVVRKGEKESILYFSNETAQAINNYIIFRANYLKKKKIDIESLAPLFLSLQNKRISVRAVENIVKKYTKEVTPLKNISPHKLRSTYGTALYRSTKDIYVVAEVLGHKDINTTKKHYAALDEDIKKSASETKLYKKDE